MLYSVLVVIITFIPKHKRIVCPESIPDNENPCGIVKNNKFLQKMIDFAGMVKKNFGPRIYGTVIFNWKEFYPTALPAIYIALYWKWPIMNRLLRELLRTKKTSSVKLTKKSQGRILRWFFLLKLSKFASSQSTVLA